jgi:hypothetical protein
MNNLEKYIALLLRSRQTRFTIGTWPSSLGPSFPTVCLYLFFTKNFITPKRVELQHCDSAQMFILLRPKNHTKISSIVSKWRPFKMFDVKFHENRLFQKIITSDIKVSLFYVVFSDTLFVKIGQKLQRNSFFSK